ncbi:MAG TPA: hypothetical protein VE178_14765 [Silvibacterium sp.]|nr:hypothetical protein [Silvibacterium sp.]
MARSRSLESREVGLFRRAVEGAQRMSADYGERTAASIGASL